MLEQRIRNMVLGEELDYTLLTSALGDYKRPRDKITSLMKKGVLIRVKKGLYVFGPEFARRPYSREILANLIYGPSYVSLHYALFWYGLIPEHAIEVTSVTFKRDKRFDTPVGRFRYRYLHPENFAVGISRERVDKESSFLIATQEKALADLLVLESHGIRPKNPGELLDYLTEDLRCDEKSLRGLHKKHLDEIASSYQNPVVNKLAQAIRILGGK